MKLRAAKARSETQLTNTWLNMRNPPRTMMRTKSSGPEKRMAARGLVFLLRRCRSRGGKDSLPPALFAVRRNVRIAIAGMLLELTFDCQADQAGSDQQQRSRLRNGREYIHRESCRADRIQGVAVSPTQNRKVVQGIDPRRRTGSDQHVEDFKRSTAGPCSQGERSVRQKWIVTNREK